MLSEKISGMLGGIRSGNGFRVRSICHNGDDRNLKLWDSPDGKLLAKCFSHNCSYRVIMESLENEGFKEKEEFSLPEKRKYAIKKTRFEAQKELQVDLHVMWQIITDRMVSYTLRSDKRYMALHPDHAPMSLAPWDKELETTKRIQSNLKLAYGL